ncbi:MAG: ABC transporter permease [Methanomicrobiales archaeon]|nr:ABC transporter permease [Methanomicrobiales archaeon]
MRPDRLWQREILEQVRRRRSCVVKFVLPLVLTAPLLLLHVPESVRADAFTLLLIFIGVFGTAVGLIRARESGMMVRLAVLPASPARLTGEYLLTHSLFDGLQFLVPLLLIAAPRTRDPFTLIVLGLTFFMVIFAANAIGGMVAVAAGSSGEGHLFAILSVLVVMGLSGLFRDIEGRLDPGIFLPFHYFRDVLLSSAFPIPGIVLSLVVVAALFGTTLLISPRLFRML